jgi:CheY-like chemotaxis protein
MLTLLLEDSGYTVITAANGKDALSILAKNRVDLVLTDFNLPDMTGPTVIRYVRQHENGSGRIPVVVLTAVDAYEYRDMAAEAGCDAFLSKPTDFQILHRTIERLLKENKASAELFAWQQKNEG